MEVVSDSEEILSISWVIAVPSFLIAGRRFPPTCAGICAYELSSRKVFCIRKIIELIVTETALYMLLCK